MIQNYERYQKPDRITLDNLVRLFFVDKFGVK